MGFADFTLAVDVIIMITIVICVLLGAHLNKHDQGFAITINVLFAFWAIDSIGYNLLKDVVASMPEMMKSIWYFYFMLLNLGFIWTTTHFHIVRNIAISTTVKTLLFIQLIFACCQFVRLAERFVFDSSLFAMFYRYIMPSLTLLTAAIIILKVTTVLIHKNMSEKMLAPDMLDNA